MTESKRNPLRSTRAWFDRFGKRGTDLDNPALDRTATCLLEAMIAAGGESRNFERLAVLAKVSSMVMLTAFQRATEDEIVEQCHAFGQIIADSALNYQHVIEKDMRREQRSGAPS